MGAVQGPLAFDVFELWLTIQRGQLVLWLGDHTIGERLPDIFRRSGLGDLRGAAGGGVFHVVSGRRPAR